MIKAKKTKLEHEIDSLISSMEEVEGDTEEYTAMAKNVETLCKAKSYVGSDRPDVNTLISVSGNLLGIILILNYEKLGVITSKGMTFVRRN